MNILMRRTSRPSRLAWLLLWAALLLPLTQALASGHLQSHWNPQRISSGEKYGLTSDPCDLCLGAAALSAGGATCTPLPVSPIPIRQAVVQPASAAFTGTPPALAYRSRAPPPFLR